MGLIRHYRRPQVGEFSGTHEKEERQVRGDLRVRGSNSFIRLFIDFLYNKRGYINTK